MVYFSEEARLKHRLLVLREHEIAHRSSWEQFGRLERLQDAVRLARARLGLTAASEAL
jgi:hypothetical protein